MQRNRLPSKTIQGDLYAFLLHSDTLLVIFSYCLGQLDLANSRLAVTFLHTSRR